ncbi:MAG: DUF5110 domain-containing protein [Bacteroidetes bacterium]|nr:DUF5110 domain-containing protein [Bacteroidota bacterium]
MLKKIIIKVHKVDKYREISILLLSFILFCSGPTLLAQEAALNKPIGHFREFSFSSRSLEIEGDNGQIILTHYAPDIIRVRVSDANINDWKSYAVILEPSGEFQFRFNSKVLILTTDSLKIEIEKYPLHIRIFTYDNKLVTEHYFGLTISWLGGVVSQYHRLFQDEIFLGLGDQPGSLNRRGQYFENNGIVESPENGISGFGSFIPFFLGIHDSLTYGIFLDHTGRSSFNFGAGTDDQYYSFSSSDGTLDYYFIWGKSVKSILSKFTALTGKMEMPPLWALGYHHSRQGYSSNQQVIRTAEEFREKGFPADIYCLDMFSTRDFEVFTWDPKRFDHPSVLTGTLKDAGFRTSMQVDAGVRINPGFDIYQDGINHDHFIKYPGGLPYTGNTKAGRCHFPDLTNRETYSWWKGHFKSLADAGVRSICFDPNTKIVRQMGGIPDIIELDGDGTTTSMMKVRNLYYLMMASSAYEAMKTHLKNERSLVLAHNAYAGIQRYAATWNGFILPGEDIMLEGVRRICSMGLSGVPLCGSDIGGSSGIVSPSLYLRWLNIAIYNPIFINTFDADAPEQMPWSYGEKTEAIARNIFNKRYSLLPYIYSSLYESNQSGIPLARSLAIEYPFDLTIYAKSFENQFQLGKNLLIIPAYSDEKITRVYLPEGNWFFANNDRYYTGPCEIMVACPVDSIPVFVREGSIIPMQSPVISCLDSPSDTLSIHIYAGNNQNSFTYYEDDGYSYNYQKGNYYKRIIDFNPHERLLHFHKSTGTYSSRFKKLKLVFHGFVKTVWMEINLSKHDVITENNLQIIILDNLQDDIYLRW